MREYPYVRVIYSGKYDSLTRSTVLYVYGEGKAVDISDVVERLSITHEAGDVMTLQLTIPRPVLE